ncbi:hypothetical protein [[Clostridium] aminophilum]|uniref:hypothetical protein n=1 Tax=[Clostridium] aminophilum TaxID=1526 RepID=UPI0004E18F3B|nr:hypothetical protein [[Clostridium] aminophilum]
MYRIWNFLFRKDGRQTGWLDGWSAAPEICPQNPAGSSNGSINEELRLTPIPAVFSRILVGIGVYL